MLREEQIDLRRQRAKAGRFVIENLTKKRVFSEYRVTNPESQGQYTVTVHGFDIGDNTCTCPDFKSNTLGTCKHIEAVLEELKDALAATLEMEREALGDSPEEMLQLAANRAGDLPFVIIVDTAMERVARVSRNDGPFLGSLAEIAKNLNIFIGLALDDDIAGADGVNVAIARTYSIDYLDTDHLYRIVNTYVFPKNPQEVGSLKEVYNYFRRYLPGFHWSEQKFTYLYPLHPLILEIAPFVRLYVKEFALMGFASEAGTKILGRPANSLICLDEVFDKVELSLRKSDELQEAFAAFDRVNNEVINQIPVIQRLQAKLILKTLLLLSLNGEGATDTEVSAATLIFDEDNLEDTSRPVREILQKFAEALPNEINRIVEKSGQIRYSFKVAGKDSLNQALREAALGISSDVVPKILRRFASERFSDWVLLTENEVFDSVDCNVIWRGGIRRGRVIWDWYETLGLEPSMRADSYDWEVIITRPEREVVDTGEGDSILKVYWRPAQLRPDEVEVLLRYHVLVTDTWLQEEFGDQISIAGHALMTTVGKIWERIFLEEGELIIDGKPHRFTDIAKNSRSLSITFTEMLTPAFEAHYPEHPVFGEVLGINEVSALVSSFFGSRRVNAPETQALAVNFAEPLNLVTMRGDILVPCSQEDLLHLPTVQKIISFLNETDREVVPLKEIYHLLRHEPYGLVREAVQLILSALVAKRRLEFITSEGNRINWRSLDLKIIWDDIVGIARSEVVSYSSAELIEWAKTLTSADNFQTLDDPQDREKIYEALTSWLKDWRTARILD
ncbi:MAG: SWIM zinc finger domain-containing protein, partial [Pyrinomonadaceae bacterium]